jgi:uncharacterized protein YjdB
MKPLESEDRRETRHSISGGAVDDRTRRCFGTAILARQFGPAIGAAIASFGCAASDAPNYNTDTCLDRVVAIVPATPSLSVGDTITFNASYTYIHTSGPCDPDVPATSLRWGSTDPATVAIDSLTGRLTGLRVGIASVTLRVPGGTSDLAAAQVTVTTP